VQHATDRETADICGRVEVRDECLQRMAGLKGRSRNVLVDDLEQRLEVSALHRRIERGTSRPGVAVHDGEFDLLLVRVEVQEELIDLVHDLLGTRVGAVDLVDHEHHRQAPLERLAQHEASLRQGTLAGVHQQEHTIDHGERSLDLSAEVRVPRSVDDVELHPSVAHGGVLGQDGDPLLALEIHGVHHALVDLLIGPEHARLPQHPVDERRLAVVDVGDDREVAEVGAREHLGRTPEKNTAMAAGHQSTGSPCRTTICRRPPPCTVARERPYGHHLVGALESA
jgi:hypothetical protein